MRPYSLSQRLACLGVGGGAFMRIGAFARQRMREAMHVSTKLHKATQGDVGTMVSVLGPELAVREAFQVRACVHGRVLVRLAVIPPRRRCMSPFWNLMFWKATLHGTVVCQNIRLQNVRCHTKVDGAGPCGCSVWCCPL